MLKTVSASAKANVDGMTPRPYSTIHVFGPHSTAVASPGPCTTVSPGGQTGSILMRSPALPCPFHGLCALYVEVKNEKTVSRKEEKKTLASLSNQRGKRDQKTPTPNYSMAALPGPCTLLGKTMEDYPTQLQANIQKLWTFASPSLTHIKQKYC